MSCLHAAINSFNHISEKLGILFDCKRLTRKKVPDGARGLLRANVIEVVNGFAMYPHGYAGTPVSAGVRQNLNLQQTDSVRLQHGITTDENTSDIFYLLRIADRPKELHGLQNKTNRC